MHIKADAGDEPLRNVRTERYNSRQSHVCQIWHYPAPQILLQGRSVRLAALLSRLCRSDEDGNYSFSVYADQAYTIQVVDDAWAATAAIAGASR